MMRCLRRVDNMKPSHCWTSNLLMFIMAVLCLTLKADNEASNCETEIKVRRNTVHNPSVGEQLRIYCLVHVCNSTPEIYWFKLGQTEDYRRVNTSTRIKTEWTSKNNIEGKSVLIFQNVFSNDSGQYQCRSGNDVSHSIMVRVSGGTGTANVTSQDLTNSTSTHDHDNKRQMWLYLYSAAGIIGIVIIVIVTSVLTMRGCNGKQMKKAQTENQYMAIPMTEQPSQHSSNHALPRGSPCAATSHRSSRKNTSAQPQSNNVYGEIEGDTERQRNGLEEEGSTVVYAALNHQQLAGATPRPRMMVEERSEYAAIRVS